MGLGDKSEVDLNLPALVNLCCAAVAAGGPGAVGDADKVGAGKEIKRTCLLIEENKLEQNPKEGYVASKDFIKQVILFYKYFILQGSAKVNIKLLD